MKKKPTIFSEMPIEAQIGMINQALSGDVLPMLASHGGGMEIYDINGWDVTIKYYGTCHGCPLASSGTLEFIEYTLQSQIDEKIRVIPA